MSALVALVNIGAVVAPMAICTRFVHQAIARFALACEGRVSVDAIHIVVAVIRRRSRQCGLQAAFIYIRTKETIAPIPRLGALTCVASGRDGANQVCANSVGAAQMGFQCTLVDIGTSHTIPGVPGRATATEAACGIHAVIRVEAIMRSLCALINLRARICSRPVARLACARPPNEMWQMRWTSQAVCAAAPIARDTVYVTGGTRSGAAIVEADRTDGNALVVVQERSYGWAGETICGRAAASGTANVAGLTDRI